MNYNYHYGQIALAIVLLVGIIAIVKPSLFVYIPKYIKYRFYDRRKMIKSYENATQPIIKKYNDLVDLIAATRRKADDKLYETYNHMLSKGLPESLARKTADDLNHQAIETCDKFIQEHLIPVRNLLWSRHTTQPPIILNIRLRFSTKHLVLITVTNRLICSKT